MLNLWELITHAAECPSLDFKRGEIKSMIRELSDRSAYGQELSIGTTERGWVVEIHSCFTDMKVVVLVPRDPQLPVEIVEDTRASAVPLNDGR